MALAAELHLVLAPLDSLLLQLLALAADLFRLLLNSLALVAYLHFLVLATRHRLNRYLAEILLWFNRPRV